MSTLSFKACHDLKVVSGTDLLWCSHRSSVDADNNMDHSTNTYNFKRVISTNATVQKYKIVA